jgi:hypothetical protein
MLIGASLNDVQMQKMPRAPYHYGSGAALSKLFIAGGGYLIALVRHVPYIPQKRTILIITNRTVP